MKRELIIYLTDGTTITKDLTDFIRDAQTNPQIPRNQRIGLNPSANDPILIGLAQTLTCAGVELPGSTPGLVTWVAPSQIKTVQIKFEAKLTVN